MGKNILYIEDNPDNMLLVQRAVESRGYNLLKAENGLSGVDVAENQEIDLILLDINLPDIDGYEVAQRLRKSGKSHLAYIPIIAITDAPHCVDAWVVIDGNHRLRTAIRAPMSPGLWCYLGVVPAGQLGKACNHVLE